MKAKVPAAPKSKRRRRGGPLERGFAQVKRQVLGIGERGVVELIMQEEGLSRDDAMAKRAEELGLKGPKSLEERMYPRQKRPRRKKPP